MANRCKVSEIFVVVLALVGGVLLGVGPVQAGDCEPLQPTLESFKSFIEAGCFRGWPRDHSVRLSGALGKDGTPYTVHGRFQVYYSPSMADWMESFRPGSRPISSLMPAPPDGSAMIAAVYPERGPTTGAPESWIFMLRDSVASFDGWFWGGFGEGSAEARFGLGRCLACHASALSSQTFANYENIERAPHPLPPFEPLPLPGRPLSPPRAPARNELSKPLGPEAAREFIRFYRQVSGLDLPDILDPEDVVPIPPESTDHVFALGEQTYIHGAKTGEQFVTSDQCQGCHDGTELLSNTRPNMVFEAQPAPRDPAHLVDLSQYGEWSVSLMALASRDPVFLAQAETERDLKPGVDPNAIDDICYSCHGPMGQRQYHLDLITGAGDQPFFSHFMVFSTPRESEFYQRHKDRFPFNTPLADPRYSEFGGLARDGVSCGICHHLGPFDGSTLSTDPDWQVFYGPEDQTIPRRQNPMGPPYPLTSNFQFDTRTIYSPLNPFSEEPGAASHAQALGMNLVQQGYFEQAEMCGGCHVVIVPQIPDSYSGNPKNDPTIGLAYEQTTYFEYLVSEYSLYGLSCQGCHMPDLLTSADESLEIANIESNLYPEVFYRAPDEDITLKNGDGLQAKSYARHRLLGINLFVHEMFQQFNELLGIDPGDPLAPDGTVLNLLNAKQSIIEHAIGDPPTVSVQICGFGEEETGDTRKLTTEVLVTNNAGHKFPTGAGFRRAWVRFEALDANDEPVWTSGAFNQYGVLIDPATGEPLESEFTLEPNEIQKHFETIRRPTEVQTYEVRAVDCRAAEGEEPGDSGFSCDCAPPMSLQNNCPPEGTRAPQLTTSTLTLFQDVKDNRILPRGWGLNLGLTSQDGMIKGLEVDTMLAITGAEGRAEHDPYYAEPALAGSDLVTYEVEIPADVEVRRVRATMHYQTTPPYFLVDRFRDGKTQGSYGTGFGPSTERLIYMTSHLDTEVETPQRLIHEA
ncbi:MAG: hypothetical protein AAF501_06725, partial [Pseudomonadota bacterium]